MHRHLRVACRLFRINSETQGFEIRNEIEEKIKLNVEGRFDRSLDWISIKEFSVKIVEETFGAF